VLKFLNKPYPAHAPESKQRWIALGIGLFIALTLILLEPFGLNLLETNYKTLKLAGYGVITFVLVYLFHVALPVLFPKYFSYKNWVVYKEILSLILLITTIGICNGIYSKFIFVRPIQFPNMLGLIAQTFILGSVPAAFLVTFDYFRSTKKYEEQSDKIKSAILDPVEPINQPKQFILKGDNEGEKLEINSNQLLYIESNANYVTICCEKNGVLEKQLFRSSLTNMERQMSNEPALKRCHRSYIINLNRVQGVSGNAQGFQLSLPPLKEKLPVSRKYVNVIRAWFD